MPEPDATETREAPAQTESSAAGGTDGAETGAGAEASPEKRSRWVYFGLGLSLQTFLWFLLFLAITIAVLVGNKLTEFRYVGF